MTTRNYQEIADTYVRQVLDGTIPVCKLTRLAVQRHVDDLARRDNEDYRWDYDPDRGARACRFIEKCPHTKGRRFAGKPLILEPWQVWLVMTAFSWIDKITKLRRFRRVYTEIAKGNGKSPLIAALTLYMAFADNEPGAEVYCAAWGIKQARIVFDTARQMAEAMPRFRAAGGIEVGQYALTQARSNSFIKPLSKEAKMAEGSNPYFICLDELHVHPKRDLHDNLVTANEKRDGSMLWVITTAGSDLTSVCYDQHDYVTKILNGVIEDDTYLGVIWSADDKDDIWAESTWRKANPNWGVSVNPQSLADEAKRAKQLPSAQAAFQTKHLNIWLQTDHAWLDIRRLKQCADPTLKLEQFLGQPCVIGLDLASKLDLLAKIQLFWKYIDGQRHLYAFGRYWTPEARLDANASYRGWQIAGYLNVVEGEVNDFDLVEDAIREDCKKFQVIEVGHDPYQAVELVNHLLRERIPMVEVPQKTAQFDPAMKEFEGLVMAGRFHYDSDPVLTWALSNIVCHPDKNDALFPNKSTAESKIDPGTALLTGLFRLIALAATDKLKSTPRRTHVLVYDCETGSFE